MADDNPSFSACDLWASAGVPYREPDTVELLSGAVIRIMTFVAVFTGISALSVDATVVPA